jgi:ABC-type proline/glycine betaine transport system permease subunit
MDPIPGGRMIILITGGFAVGYGATLLVDGAGGNPLLASLIVALGAVLVGIWLRRFEFLNLVVESAIFAYCSYVGIALVRTPALQNFFAQHLDNGTPYLTPIVLLVGIGFAVAIVFLIAMPAWMIAARLSERPDPNKEKFWSFVESHIESDK